MSIIWRDTWHLKSESHDIIVCQLLEEHTTSRHHNALAQAPTTESLTYCDIHCEFLFKKLWMKNRKWYSGPSLCPKVVTDYMELPQKNYIAVVMEYVYLKVGVSVTVYCIYTF